MVHTGETAAIERPREIQAFTIWYLDRDQIPWCGTLDDAKRRAAWHTSPIEIRSCTIQIGAVVQVESAKGEK